MRAPDSSEPMLSKKIVWLLIIAHLTVGLATYGFSVSGLNGHWLAHELDHNGVVPPSAEHLHVSLHLSDGEHQLLHGTSHFHPFFVISLFNGLEKLIPHKAMLPSPATVQCQTTLEPPYRPPQPFFIA